MNVDYYSLLMKAVAGKDSRARDKIYKDAYNLVARSNLPHRDASLHVEHLKTPFEESRVTSLAKNWTSRSLPRLSTGCYQLPQAGNR